MSYVDRIIEAFGGVREMARKTQRPPSTVMSWRTRGQIPDSAKPSILAAARASGHELTPADFFPGDPDDLQRAS